MARPSVIMSLPGVPYVVQHHFPIVSPVAYSDTDNGVDQVKISDSKGGYDHSNSSVIPDVPKLKVSATFNH